MDDETPFPWRAVYKALVQCLGELADQYPVSATRLVPEVSALAKMHAEVLERGQRHDDD